VGEKRASGLLVVVVAPREYHLMRNAEFGMRNAEIQDATAPILIPHFELY